MNALRRAAWHCIALVAPAMAFAQAKPPAPPECPINNVNSLPAAAKVAFATVLSTSTKSPSDKQKQMVRDGMKSLMDKTSKADPMLVADYMTRAYYFWLADAAMPATVKRSDVGLVDQPDGMINLYTAIDSTMTSMEKAQPACKEGETNRYRRALWATLINNSVPYLNVQPGADSVAYKRAIDSAGTLLTFATAMNPDDPRGYFYYSYVGQKKGDNAGAIVALTKAIQLSTPDALAKDTALKLVRRDAMLNLGVLYQNQAETLTGEAKKQAALSAAGAFKAYLAAHPDSPDVAKVQAALTRVLMVSGDEGALASIKEDMLKNPKKYSDAQLIAAGAEAFNKDNKSDANREMAARYFVAALESNPNSRDALFNLLNMQATLKKYDDVLVTGPRLITIDPNNATTFHQIAYAYQELAKVTPDAKLKKARSDSALLYAGKESKMAAIVTVQAVERDANRYGLHGVIENKLKTSQKMTVHFEFLDAQGNVVGSADAKGLTAAAAGTFTVNPSGKEPFEVFLDKPGIMAYRYSVR